MMKRYCSLQTISALCPVIVYAIMLYFSENYAPVAFFATMFVVLVAFATTFTAATLVMLSVAYAFAFVILAYLYAVSGHMYIASAFALIAILTVLVMTAAIESHKKSNPEISGNAAVVHHFAWMASVFAVTYFGATIYGYAALAVAVLMPLIFFSYEMKKRANNKL